MAQQPVDISVFDAADREAEEQALAEAEAALAAGHVIPYGEVRRWLLSWGTETELPPPKCE
jgi:predicted transcriptional regulator